MKTQLAFDIETIPDADSIRLLHGLPEHLSDAQVVDFMMQKRRAHNGSDFMPLHLHKVVAISCCMRWKANLIHVATIGSEDDSEESMIADFFDLIEKYQPQLISWNGGGFDLPVLHYRGLLHGIEAKRYWEVGEGDYGDSRDYKWNNYINRYHQRHCDLMDMLALFQPRANAPLDEMAKLCGFPGKLGMDGSQVWSAYQDGKIGEIRSYCETDAANTYLMFLRFNLMRGILDADQYHTEIELLRHYLTQQEDKIHWQEFCRAWSK